MPVVLRDTRFSQSVQATVDFVGLSQLSPNEKRMTASLPGGWTVIFAVPTQEPLADSKYAGLWFGWPDHITKTSEFRRFRIAARAICCAEESTVYGVASGTIECLPGKFLGWKSFMLWENVWFEGSLASMEDAIRLEIDIESTSLRPTLSYPDISENIMEQIDGTDSVDIKFFAFSTRTVTKSDGKVHATNPLPVYANTKLLRGRCNYFSSMLSAINTYAESSLVPLDRPATDLTVEYDYDSDSDLADSETEDEDARTTREIENQEPTSIGDGVENKDGSVMDEDGSTGSIENQESISKDNDNRKKIDLTLTLVVLTAGWAGLSKCRTLHISRGER